MKTAIQKDAEGNVIEVGTKSDEEVLAEGGTIEEIEVDEEEEDEVVEAPVSERDQVMATVAEKRRKQNETDPDSQDENDDESGTADDVVPPADQMVDLKVNGETVQRTQVEVDAAGGVAAIQKSISGEMKLEQAAEAQKKVDREREEVRVVIGENIQLKQDIVDLKAASTQTQGKPALSKEELETKAREIAGKFFLGDQAELEIAVQELLAAGNIVPPVAAAPVAAPIDEEAVANRVAKKLEFETERKEAVSMFETDHADMNTPMRRGHVNQLTNEIMKDNPTWGPKKVITEAVKQSREGLGIPAPAAAPKPKTDLKSKKERKRATTDAIPQASQRVAAPVAKDQPKTRRQIFEEMEASRSH